MAELLGDESQMSAEVSTDPTSSAVGARPHVLIVLGCTGVGKTKLGLALARRFRGEVISCDSIQVYEGMPIASNQCTEEEAGGIRQHCLSIAPPWRAMQVQQFRRTAKALIEAIHLRGNTTVIVGGTFYWLESLLFKTFLSREDDSQEPIPVDETAMMSTEETAQRSVPSCDFPFSSSTEEWRTHLQSLATASVQSVSFVRSVLTASTPSPSAAHLFELLSLVDSPSASKLHPNNHRKLLRALQVYVESGGRTYSDLIASTGGVRGSAGLQYDVQCVWLDCDPAVLDERLDRRIDEMMRRGLLQEAEDMYRLLLRRQQGNPLTYARAGWKCSNPLDPDCDICNKAESSDILPSIPLPQSSSSSLASITAPSTAPLGFEYLGPTELQFDYERGLGQALGLKEFRPYFQCKFHTAADHQAQVNEAATQATRPAVKKQKLSATQSAELHVDDAGLPCNSTCTTSSSVALHANVAACVSSLKSRTRSYARVQSRWIKSRLWPAVILPISDPTRLPMLRLDASKVDAETWATRIEQPAMEVFERFLCGESVDLAGYAHLAAALPALPTPEIISPAVPLPLSVSPAAEVWQKYTCDACESTCNGAHEWAKHLSSRKHRARTTSDVRKAKQIEAQAEVQKQRQAKKEAAAAAVAMAATNSDALS